MPETGSWQLEMRMWNLVLSGRSQPLPPPTDPPCPGLLLSLWCLSPGTGMWRKGEGERILQGPGCLLYGQRWIIFVTFLSFHCLLKNRWEFTVLLRSGYNLLSQASFWFLTPSGSLQSSVLRNCLKSWRDLQREEMVPWLILLSELVTTAYWSGGRSSAGEVHILAASKDV